jgi:hypothetical protein
MSTEKPALEKTTENKSIIPRGWNKAHPIPKKVCLYFTLMSRQEKI